MPQTHGTALLTCGADGIVALMDVPSKQRRAIFKHRGRAHRIGIIPNCPDSFISCGEDGLCCLFDIRDSRQSFFSDTDVLHSSTTIDEQSESTYTSSPSGRSLVHKATFFDHRARKCPIYSVGVNPIKPNEIIVAGGTSHVSVFDTRNFVNPVSYLCPVPISESSDDLHITGVRYNFAGNTVLASYNDEAIYSMQMDLHSISSHRIAGDKNSSKRSRDEEGDNDSSMDTKSIVVDSDTPILPSPSIESGYSMKFTGHNNCDTVKQVSYLGGRSEFVLSGSDCGHIFIWEASTGKLLKLLNADDTGGAVNCLSAHPHLPFLASSGLSKDAKLWGPTGEYCPLVEGAEACNYANKVMSDNANVFQANARVRNSPLVDLDMLIRSILRSGVNLQFLGTVRENVQNNSSSDSDDDTNEMR